jgi:hypothetical protein
VHLGRGELDLGEGRDQRRVAAAERRRVEDRGVDARVVRGVELVDDLPSRFEWRISTSTPSSFA